MSALLAVSSLIPVENESWGVYARDGCLSCFLLSMYIFSKMFGWLLDHIWHDVTEGGLRSVLATHSSMAVIPRRSFVI